MVQEVVHNSSSVVDNENTLFDLTNNKNMYY